MQLLDDLVRRIEEFARRTGIGPLVQARHEPEGWGRPGECFTNASKKQARDGGAVLFGWMFHYRETLSSPPIGYLIAANHAIWNAPDKSLVDVTPFHAEEKHRPLLLGANVLFVIDGQASPITDGTTGVALPSWFLPIEEGDTASDYVAGLQRTELSSWSKGIEGSASLEKAANLHPRRPGLEATGSIGLAEAPSACELAPGGRVP